MNAKILRIAVPSPLYRSFDYLAPESVVPLQPGIRVRVPFGRGQKTGILLEVRDDSPVPSEALRPIEAVLDSEPLLPPDLLELSLWAERYYHHPPGEVFATALPVLLRQGRAACPRYNPLWRITDAGRQALQAGALQRAPRRQAVLACLAEHPAGMPAEQLQRELPGWSKSIRVLVDQGWVEKLAGTVPVVSPLIPPPALNPAQEQAVTAVCAALGRFGVFLLDGVTGSGKTEVYLRVVEAVLDQHRQALVIVPEIGLTPQLLARFESRLHRPLAVLHSGLGDRERLNAWLAARDGTVAVVIGTRSAVFTPLQNAGVIIVDEEHDTSFKQQEGFRYHARDLAVVRARWLGIPVVLGSATPSLESLLNVQRGRYQCLRLPERVGDAVEPPIEILDVRSQPLTEGLSRPLLAGMHAHLEQGGQVLLFLNRRGFAPTLICHECGWLSQCRRCDARLTLHLQRRKLICHHCGAEQPLPIACPACGSVDLRALGQGTERIEQALQRAFPAMGIARLDRDSTRRKGSLQALLEAIHQGERRILIGTQMLAKGHHFPNVTLVGIVDADQGLFGADFRASERMAQLILQVAGRAGRAEKPGVVVIQTHHPQHPLLLTLVSRGYSAFAAAALTERQAAQLPPFTWQALLRADAIDAEAPQAFLTEALERGRRLGAAVELWGPVPAPMERRAGRYRAQLLVQAAKRSPLHEFLDNWVERLGELKTARKVRWSLDVDPQDLL
jgi:primosomal protein N' (replication factor Y)